MTNVNKIRDQIELAIEITRDSGVPVLLIANPGLAKSTIVANWARRNSYHIETLIGSRYSQEEILGFQVRIEDTAAGEFALEILEPRWYRTVVERAGQGVPSVLFLDEISTAQENVQGALLQLVFERTIGHGKKLPESALVLAAANYKQNIPWQFNMMAPMLNRFCIVNLSYESNDSFLNEFLQNPSDWNKELPVYENRELTEEDQNRLRSGLKGMFRTLFRASEETDAGENSDAESGAGRALDINNQIYNNMYEGNTRYVYNFISGRTLSYLFRITLSFLRKGLSFAEYGKPMLNMVAGLIGIGTNTSSEKQQQSYRRNVETLYAKLYAALSPETAAPDSSAPAAAAPLDFSGREAADAIQEWVLFRESSLWNDADDPNLSALAAYIEGVYGTTAEAVEAVRQRNAKNRADRCRFSNDMQRLEYLLSLLEDDAAATAAAERPAPAAALRKIRDAYAAAFEEALEDMAAGLR
jgi:MoxR-like ATPase